MMWTSLRISREEDSVNYFFTITLIKRCSTQSYEEIRITSKDINIGRHKKNILKSEKIMDSAFNKNS